MSVGISEILKLPSLYGAKVIAGKGGLNRQISTISVSEYTHGEQFENLEIQTYGSGGEIVISAFYASRDDVEMQCKNIEEYHRYHVAGLILFYVGVVLPYVDAKVIALANERNFPIIMMPEGRADLKYSDVIYEVMEAVLKSNLTGASLRYDTIKQVSEFPANQRGLGAILQLLSIKTHSTILLFSADGKLLNAATWPSNINADVFLQFANITLQDDIIRINGEIYKKYMCGIVSAESAVRQAVIFKRGDLLTPDVVEQIGETIEVACKLWEDNRKESYLAELVGSVMRDEPYKIRRIAAQHNLDLPSIKHMWIIHPLDPRQWIRFVNTMPLLIENHFSYIARNLILDSFDDRFVALIDNKLSHAHLTGAANDLVSKLAATGLQAVVVECLNVPKLEEMRKIYLSSKEFLPTALEIYPHKNVFSLSDIRFSKFCKDIVDKGGESVQYHTELLKVFNPSADGGNDSLLETLQVYYLDTECNAKKAAEILYVHKNTIQYRLNKIKEMMSTGLQNYSEQIELYLALALNRIMDKEPGMNENVPSDNKDIP